MKAGSPIVKHLVLVGGGHSHLAVLKRLGMRPVPGLGLTLISRDINTPYSGSLPGHISGVYGCDDIHIDLRPLARLAGARIIQQEVRNIDLAGKKIVLDSRPPIAFDLLSLNIGSRPDPEAIPGAGEFAHGVKPIDSFLACWRITLDTALASLRQGREFRIAIVGGGPAGVELAFATQYRIHRELQLKPTDPSPLQIQLINAEPELLPAHNARVRKFARIELEKRGITVTTDSPVSAFAASTVICTSGQHYSADRIIYATGAGIPAWPGQCGLALSGDGFIEVNHHLQSTSHDFVFAAGDAATIKGAPRPKSGVYAVRQGPVLARNLVRFATGKSLSRYRPQRHALALLSMGGNRAMASRNNFFMHGRGVWTVKHRIDSAFIRKYSRLPEMPAQLELSRGLVDRETEQQLRAHAMRCAGCGGKVAGNILRDVLQQLPEHRREDMLGDTGMVEDASMIRLNDGRVLVQSIDQLQAFINDPWLFGRIATNHCLSDIYAMGCEPHSALAVVGLPFAGKSHARAQLHELMLACGTTLKEQGCALAGGHSAEAGELSLGLCVNGFSDEQSLLTKGGMAAGEVLILTGPLGTGALLAADMRGRASQQWMHNALEQMARSNRAACHCLLEAGATACTDVTGFGLAGHLLEMLAADNGEVELNLAELPVLEGALETLAGNIVSSLHGDNRLVIDHLSNHEHYAGQPRLEILFDPQTAGGLLASIPQANAGHCLEKLREAGYSGAAIIGRVKRLGAEQPAIILQGTP